MYKVPFTSLKRSFEMYQEEYEAAVLGALRSGWYVLGKELSSFESEFASYLGARECVGVGCGQDALILAIRALGIGCEDEVIVAGNTYIATVIGVTENGATPIFVDCNEFYQIDETLVEQAITEKTKAVLTTNLYGQCSDLPSLRKICDKHGLKLVEDCAQSHGAAFKGRMSGTVGDVSCFSFYPTKPLGAFGDGGAITTNDSYIAEKLRMLRNYGSKEKYHNEILGINSRLDEIQAAALRVGLSHIEDSTRVRSEIARRYLSEISNPFVKLPKTRNGANHVYHIFSILCEERDELKSHLEMRGIQAQIHYPIPPHKAACYKDEPYAQVSLPKTERFAKEQLSLPIYSGMPKADVDAVIEAVNSFRK